MIFVVGDRVQVGENPYAYTVNLEQANHLIGNDAGQVGTVVAATAEQRLILTIFGFDPKDIDLIESINVRVRLDSDDPDDSVLYAPDCLTKIS